jgi:hypothetical protein
MLYVALVLAVVLVVVANVAVHRRGNSFWTFVFFALWFSFGLSCMGLSCPPVLGLAVLLPLLMVPWFFTDKRPWLFLPLSIFAFVLCFGVATWYAFVDWRQYDDQRAVFPFESMEDRLDGTHPAERPGPLSPETIRGLEEIEDQFHPTRRSAELRKLHEGTTSEFANSPGFGVTRMGMMRSHDEYLALKPVPKIVQPFPSAMTPAPETQHHVASRGDDLHGLHLNGILDFAGPRGWGYFKDREHVTGFQSHRFSRLPEDKAWEVRRIELIGLLTHKKPVAYVTANLPRMDEVKKAPTRQLDAFESWGLRKLRGGEDLVLGESAEQVRMVGALRAARQCAECHGCERGALLGAFSYWLRKVPTERDR